MARGKGSLLVIPDFAVVPSVVHWQGYAYTLRSLRLDWPISNLGLNLTCSRLGDVAGRIDTDWLEEM